jgi:hypothetical protein
LEIAKTIYADTWRPELHARANACFKHPRRQYCDDAGLNFDVHDSAAGTLLAVVSSYAVPVKWMPRIVNYNFLPDMGRMTA